MFNRHLGLSAYFYKKTDWVDVSYAHRIIGMPGDVVEVKPIEGVWINGKVINESYVLDESDTCTLIMPTEVCAPVTVPPGHVYILGDNRNASADSRYFGFVPLSRVFARAAYRFAPSHRVGQVQ